MRDYNGSKFLQSFFDSELAIFGRIYDFEVHRILKWDCSTKRF